MVERIACILNVKKEIKQEAKKKKKKQAARKEDLVGRHIIRP
jgi:hypothetical protein